MSSLARKLGVLAVGAVALWILGRAIPIAWLAVHEPFGRDQGTLMYAAFALSKGVRDYVGTHEQNGPFVHMLWLLFYKLYQLAGDDELVVRAIELFSSILVFFAFGAALPGIGRRPTDPPVPTPSITRGVWGLLGVAMLLADYLNYGLEHRAQRESLFNVFLILSLTIQLVAQGETWISAGRRSALLVVAGALAILPGFGKPPALIFALGQLCGLLLDDRTALSRRRRAGAFGGGVVLGSMAVLAFVLRYAELGAMLRFVFYESPRFHYYIWHEDLITGWRSYENAPRLNRAAIVTVLGAGAGLIKFLPRRTWSIGFFVCGSWVTLAAQGKMFPYHQFTLTAASVMMGLVLLRLLFERGARGLVLGTALALGFAWHAGAQLSSSLTVREMTPPRLVAALTRASRREELPRLYNGPMKSDQRCPMAGADFYAWDLRRAGQYLRDNLPEHERVQLWGMDTYLMVFAQRLSATPFLYSYEINVDAALKGGPGGIPSVADIAWLRTKSRKNTRLLNESVRAAPPGAFALIDNQPFLCEPDAEADFALSNPDTWAFVREHYLEARRFGPVRIWLRKDLVRAVQAP